MADALLNRRPARLSRPMTTVSGVSYQQVQWDRGLCLLSDICWPVCSGAGIVSAGDDCAVKYTRADSADLTPSLVYKHKDFVRGLCTMRAGKQVLSYSWDHSLVCSSLS